MEALHKKQSLLFQAILEEEKPITSRQLSLLSGVSVRTVKTYIQEINRRILPFGVQILSKAREGYWLEWKEDADKEKVYALLDKNVGSKYDETPKYNYERINYIIKKLLVVDYHIKMEDLMDEIYVSRSTLTQDLKEVRALLAKFHLKVTSRSNYGLIVEGSEIDRRLCICEYFFHYNQKANYTIDSENMFNSGRSREEYLNIMEEIKNICGMYDIQLSDFSLHNLAIHVSIGMRRCMFYDYVKAEDDMLLRYQNTVEFRAADALVKYLEQQFHCMLPIGETIYYALHLQSKRISDESSMNKEDRKKIKECIHIILEEVKNNFELDFSGDEQLKQYLYMHIPQMIQRLKHHMIIRNPLVYDNLRRYLFATKVTHSAAAVIEQMYRVEVDINEFGYLLLYFNMAILKYEHAKKIRIGFVSGRGRPESIMYLNEIQEAFSSERYQVISLDKEEAIAQLSSPLDFLITTYTLKGKVNIPIYLIKNDTYLEEIRQQLGQLQYHALDFDKYFKKEYFIADMPGTTKEEVLHNFYQLLLERGYLKHSLQESMQFRDDELGNGIVHFQDLYRLLRFEMCFVIVLKHPVLWNKDIVRVLMVTKTKKDGDKDLPALCRIVSTWANRGDKVEQLIAGKDFDSFMKNLKEGLL